MHACRSTLEDPTVAGALDGWRLGEIDVLFVENVGNLVCPATFDLGEALRVVLLSVTEGEDKPLKYPTIFNTADVALVTKIDLATAVGFDAEALGRNLQAVRPGIESLAVSAKSGDGMDAWLDLVRSGLAAWRATAARSLRSAGVDANGAQRRS